MSLFKRTQKKKSTRRRKKKAGSGTPRWSWLAGFALAAVVLGIGLLQWAKTDPGQATLLGLGSDKAFAEVQVAVEEALVPVLPNLTRGAANAAGEDETGTDHDWAAPQLATGASVRCRLVPVDTAMAWWEIQERVASALAPTGARILWGERLPAEAGRRGAAEPDENTDLLRLDVGVTGRPTHTLVLHRADTRPRVRWGGGGLTAWARLAAQPGPVVAILIDDWGYSRSESCRKLLDLPAPFTLAVLPGLPYSREYSLKVTELALPAGAGSRGPGREDDRFLGRDTRLDRGCFVEVTTGREGARLAQKRREVMLHLPMEPQSYPETDPGPRAVMIGMDRTQVAERLDEALGTLAGANGVNNHMGSGATSDPATMKLLMEELKKRDMYFVDSLTSSRSVAYAAAVEAGLPAARNRIFLDYDNENEDSITANLARLVQAARSSGFALGIGHPHRATAAVLAREIPRLKAEGVRFVTVSEMFALEEQAHRAVGTPGN